MILDHLLGDETGTVLPGIRRSVDRVPQMKVLLLRISLFDRFSAEDIAEQDGVDAIGLSGGGKMSVYATSRRRGKSGADSLDSFAMLVSFFVVVLFALVGKKEGHLGLVVVALTKDLIANLQHRGDPRPAGEHANVLHRPAGHAAAL